MKYKGYLLILSTAVISGVSIFINKFGVSVFNPYIFAFLKNALVAVFLSAIVLVFWDWSSFKKIGKKQWLTLLGIGLIGGGIPFLLFFKGLSMTSAAGASFIQKTMFIWIFILAGFFLKEKITKKYIIAGVVMILANLMLLKISDINFDKGSLLVLIATILWAVENVISKHVIDEISPRIVMWSRMFFGSLFIFAFLFFSHQVSMMVKINPQQIGWVLITGIILLGYVITWYSGLKYVKVSEASIILMLGSPITTILSTIFLKPATLKEYLAIFLIIIGVLTVIGTKKIAEGLKQIYVRC
jgi:drug/metabolite transporter (DMT)-like permease